MGFLKKHTTEVLIFGVILLGIFGYVLINIFLQFFFGSTNGDPIPPTF